MDETARRAELESLQARIRALEAEVAEEQAQHPWQATGYYGVYYATTGSLLGIFGAATSLLFNIVGSLVAGKDPLELIRTYLTFPLGEQALRLSTGSLYAVSDGMILACGCMLYILTGMLLGIPVYMALARWAARASLWRRLIVASVIAIAIWLVNFYGVLSWLQPLLFRGDWIVRIVPWWAAAATHMVFGCTIALLYPLGEYKPYRRVTS
jgi:hypothetical protein